MASVFFFLGSVVLGIFIAAALLKAYIIYRFLRRF